MSTATQRERERALITEWFHRDADNPANNWPGTPLSQIPLSMSPTLRGMLEDGTARIVERPKSGARPGTANYVVVGR